ncbi:uncharacterized protein LOC126195618 [Schistocerca nitens]|uniref:uncharacterized protein LOC126195618 n=1 Tax=Schistocerca nitens TaxID=7011 RepID=UPI00211812FF|nr:uncharacterized protein LOC126195618 [Schistocerca nitens]
MGKTRHLYKKIREIKGKFQAKIGMIKDRNGKDLSEAEDVKERWAEYVEDLYKKELHNDRAPTADVNVNLELEPDILESGIQWALENMADNKTSEHDEIPAELYKVTGKDAVKVLHSICQKIWITQQWPEDWKRLVFIPFPKERSSKEHSDYRTITLISHASKVMLKILQNKTSPISRSRAYQKNKLDLGKEEELEVKLLTFDGLWKKQENSREMCTSALLTTPKPLTASITTHYGTY